jgi:carboxymethylenebutenolidase
MADGEMPGYFARPNGVNSPPVGLVAMEIFGLHEYTKDVTRRQARAFAVASDYYSARTSTPSGLPTSRNCCRA